MKEMYKKPTPMEWVLLRSNKKVYYQQQKHYRIMLMTNDHYQLFLASVKHNTFEDENLMSEIDIITMYNLLRGLECYMWFQEKYPDRVRNIPQEVLPYLTKKKCKTYNELLLKRMFEYCTTKNPDNCIEEEVFLSIMTLYNNKHKIKLITHYLRQEHIYSLTFYCLMAYKIKESNKRKKIYQRLVEVIETYFCEDFDIPIVLTTNKMVLQILLCEFERRLDIGMDDTYVQHAVKKVIESYCVSWEGVVKNQKTEALITLLAKWVNRNSISVHNIMPEKFDKKIYYFVECVFEKAEQLKNEKHNS
jgi:hypothetical protein